MKQKIFISYSDFDSIKVERIKEELEKNELFEAVIIASNREALIPLTEKVKTGIKECKFIVPILTSNSINTQWINQEIGFATALDKVIKPIVEIDIMSQLKGFIHSQVDLPYSFKANVSKAQENKDFIRCFRNILEDIKNPVFTIEQSKALFSSIRTFGKSNNKRW